MFAMIIILFFSFFISYILFYPSLALSNTLGAIDIPDDRKIHSKPMARGGGFTFFVAFSILLVLIPINIELKIPLSLSAAVIFFIGLLDDVIEFSAFEKLSGQFFGLAVYYFLSELLSYNITAFQGIFMAIWIILITNATNIVDGLDGLAVGVCASEAICLSAIALILGNIDILFCSFLLLSALLGFLPHNFPKAKIFMGDCGALFLGFTLAVISSRLISESKSITCLLSILLVFRVPIAEAYLSIIRRIIKRKNPFKADKEHFHHLLIKRGFTRECATLALVTISLFFGVLGILVSFLGR